MLITAYNPAKLLVLCTFVYFVLLLFVRIGQTDIYGLIKLQ